MAKCQATFLHGSLTLPHVVGTKLQLSFLLASVFRACSHSNLTWKKMENTSASGAEAACALSIMITFRILE